VEVLYQDGSREVEEIHDAKGHQGNPLDQRAVVDKFLGLASGFRVEAIRGLILDGDAGRSADDLFQLL
jgi:hypothetical protein